MARQHIADAPFLVPGIAGAAELTAARRDTNATPAPRHLLEQVPQNATHNLIARRAREARGLCFEGAGPVAAARAWASVLVPSFTGLFKRADRLALAMDARAYGSGPRSSLTARALTARDAAVLCIALAAVLAVAVLL